MDITLAIAIFAIGFAATFFGSFMSGAMSAIPVTLMLALGLPPHTVLGIQRVGIVGADLGGLNRYYRSGEIYWPLVLPTVLLGLIGSYLGAKLIISLDEVLLSQIIGFAILLFIPLSLWKPALGTQRTDTSKLKQTFGYLGYFLSVVWGASVHVGMGLFIMYNHLYFFGLTIIGVKATDKIAGVLRSLVVLYFFAAAGLIDWTLGCILFAGMFVGANLGAKYVIKVGNVWLRRILLIMIALLALKLVLGY